MDGKPPMRRRSSARRSMVEPRANSTEPSMRATTQRAGGAPGQGGTGGGIHPAGHARPPPRGGGGGGGQGGPGGNFPRAEHARHRHAGCEFGGYAQRFPAAGPVFGRRAIEAGDQAGVRPIEERGHWAGGVRRYPYVAVVDQQERVAGLGGEVGENADFAVRHFGGGEDQTDVARGEFRNETADIVGGGVVGAADAEQDLVLRIVLQSVRTDGFVEVRIAAVHGLQDGDGEAGGGGRASGGPAPPQGRHDHQQPVGG